MNLPLLTGSAYQSTVADGKKTCVVVFSKEACKVCAKLAPTIEPLAQTYRKQDGLDFYAMDVSDGDTKTLFKSWSLVGVPQTVFIKNGEFKEALPGALSEKILKTEIENLIRPKQGLGAKLKKLFK